MDQFEYLNKKKFISRIQFWIEFINHNQLEFIAEIGVYKGEFAEKVLENCPSIKKYYLIDPWRSLKEWNKPFNQNDLIFDDIFSNTMAKLKKYKSKIHVLRGTTLEKINCIPDNSLDFIYIDGDHTLRGITIDLISSWSKIKFNKYIAGDDLHMNIWHHGRRFEPTLVFPYVTYFAEAKQTPIILLPFKQFLIIKSNTNFKYINKAGSEYSERSLAKLYEVNQGLKNKWTRIVSRIKSFLRIY